MSIQIMILMGVSGAGKSTIGRELARQLDWAFLEGDDFHPPENISKMRQGTPLTDHDRAAWLATLAQLIDRHVRACQPAVLTCSALKRAYRTRLRAGHPRQVRFVYLRGDVDEIAGRLAKRQDHFMPPALLSSQFKDLEEPTEALEIDIGLPYMEIVGQIIADLSHFDETSVN